MIAIALCLLLGADAESARIIQLAEASESWRLNAIKDCEHAIKSAEDSLRQVHESIISDRQPQHFKGLWFLSNAERNERRAALEKQRDKAKERLKYYSDDDLICVPPIPLKWKIGDVGGIGLYDSVTVVTIVDEKSMVVSGDILAELAPNGTGIAYSTNAKAIIKGLDTSPFHPGQQLDFVAKNPTGFYVDDEIDTEGVRVPILRPIDCVGIRALVLGIRERNTKR